MTVSAVFFYASCSLAGNGYSLQGQEIVLHGSGNFSKIYHRPFQRKTVHFFFEAIAAMSFLEMKAIVANVEKIFKTNNGCIEFSFTLYHLIL